MTYITYRLSSVEADLQYSTLTLRNFMIAHKMFLNKKEATKQKLYKLNL